MTAAVRSFAKINVGLYIGARRVDGFHDLRTVYQTIALHDVIRVGVGRGGVGVCRSRGNAGHSGAQIVIRCDDPRVPLDASNTCHQMAALVMERLGAQGTVTIDIEKRLPVQGGLGAASSNAVATMLGLERALKKRVGACERLQVAAAVGSDLSLFVIGGTVLGVGRGEEVYPLPEFPSIPMVVVTPEVGVSTPKAFADWDARPHTGNAELTHSSSSDRLFEVGCALSAWLRGTSHAGAPARAGGRAGSLLSELVRAGIGNDFEEVVFSQLPELRDIKRALERAGSSYASLSGSGSTLYGMFASRAEAITAAERLRKQGLKAVVTRTLTRREYWTRMFVSR